jgi:hypothetical protein
MQLEALHILGAVFSVRENFYTFLGWTQQSQKTNTNMRTNKTRYLLYDKSWVLFLF